MTPLFDHVGIAVADRAASERFYRTFLGAIGVEPSSEGDVFLEWDDFAIGPAGPDRPATTGLHIGFRAASRAAVDAFWQAGIDAGFADDGAPGPRPQYSPDYYGAFLRDPDGNSAEAVTFDAPPRGGRIDHLWIRVADVAAAKAFYATIAPHAGLRLGDDTPDRVQFLGDAGSFSLVAGEPTGHAHLAFPAADRAAVAAFHRAAVAAGYTDNGGPGERPVYHPGYYAAYVLDPDGHNIEAVLHEEP